MPHFPKQGWPDTFTVEWHVMHKEVHMREFPDVDQGTIRNLDHAIDWAYSATYGQ